MSIPSQTNHNVANPNDSDATGKTVSEEPQFCFPGTPYPQQTALMNALYKAMDGNAIGLFESPTGTGKTLSIICAISAFLRRKPTPPADDLDWITAHEVTKEYDKLTRAANAKSARRRARVTRVRAGVVGAKPVAKRRRSKSKPAANGAGDELDDFLISEPEPKDTMGLGVSDSESDEESNMKAKKKVIPRAEQKQRPLRFIFATRTHSQLTQFVEEYRRTPHSDALSVLLYGSRKQLCVNPDVRALSSASAIADRCRDLNEEAGKKRTRTCGCPHRGKEEEELLSDKLLTSALTVTDIEDAARNHGGCPYFGVRQAVASGDADVIGVPYSAVLHPPTAKAVGFQVDEDTIVVFDEAHNIVDAVCDLNACVLSWDDAGVVRDALQAYLERYQSRLSSHNKFSVRQLLAIANGLVDVGDRVRSQGKASVRTPSALIFDAGVDNVNLFPLVEFLRESRLMNKLRGFVQHEQRTAQANTLQAQAEASTTQKTIAVRPGAGASALAPFESLVAALADCAHYARVALYPSETGRWKSTGGGIRYFVLDPAVLFKEAVGNARAVLMLGGTLSPRDAIKQRLLRGLDRKVVEFECEHVVAASHVRTLIVGNAPSGRQLTLTHQAKSNPTCIDDIGATVAALSRNAPGGVVVFFTSYDFLDTARIRWQKTGALNVVQKVKFFETRGDTTAFEKYKRAIEEDVQGGALLGAVMGGRLSEGINFSDDLGRLVVIVGMPFANARDVECAEMLLAVPNQRQRSQTLLNSCMTVVNQSVGRAVRHRNDYAVVALVDSRFNRKQTSELLPSFVSRNMKSVSRVAEACADMQRFFKERSAENS